MKILNQIKRIDSFPNTYITYRIILTMSQEKLNELAILSIEKELSKQINYETVTNDFVSKNARKVDFK
ncbi:hypothetical protein H5410_018790 [Solanum commersonii]|uniref:Uncharacterized protein n=1 Tax=Solanum commersonii TaxID=4109 RepID=A0A9J6A2Y1_SOLCO|nr:hypothetical protein H5410_018790 [Solanum commersonii]